MKKKYETEFNILTYHGKLIGDWGNIYRHCKKEGEIAIVLSNLLSLDSEGSNILIKASILHDWYKINEIEESNKHGIIGFSRSNQESFDKLIQLGVEKRIVEVAHSVGATSLKEISNSNDLLKRVMHFIDDICLEEKIVEIDERIDYNEQNPKYKDFNESGRAEHCGKTYFEMQRKIGKQIQNQIESKLNIESNSLVKLIKNSIT